MFRLWSRVGRNDELAKRLRDGFQPNAEVGWDQLLTQIHDLPDEEEASSSPIMVSPVAHAKSLRPFISAYAAAVVLLLIAAPFVYRPATPVRIVWKPIRVFTPQLTGGDSGHIFDTVFSDRFLDVDRDAPLPAGYPHGISPRLALRMEIAKGTDATFLVKYTMLRSEDQGGLIQSYMVFTRDEILDMASKGYYLTDYFVHR